MFESAELGHTVDNKAYKSESTKLREALLDVQTELLEAAPFALLILINGVDGAGKGETVNLLNEWMDPRHMMTRAFTELDDTLPPMTRFGRELPPKGKTGIFFGSWYTDPIVRRAMGRSGDKALSADAGRIRAFERMLTSEGILLLKFWFHLSKDAQRKRLRALEADKRTRWRVTKADWSRFQQYDRFRRASEHTLRETSTPEAPWHIVEGTCPNYRSLEVGRLVLESLRARLTRSEPRPSLRAAPPKSDNRGILQSLDLTKKMGKEKYARELEKVSRELNRLSREKSFNKRGVVAVFEGPDAAGKGGAIRAITGALDARVYQVIPIAAPTDEEKGQPYLWRFWRNIPTRGRFALFDRSWYGRVLVERVERFASVEAWSRAYTEIVDFEGDLTRSGYVVIKFWLWISQEQQLERFRSRETTRHKRYKITKDDWRNRKKWDAYEEAACDMIDKTSTDNAPWHLVEACDKEYARIKVMRALCEALGKV